MITRVLAMWCSVPAAARRLVPLLAFGLLVMGGLAQPAAPSTPPPERRAARYSPNVCIVTLDGEIDAITSVSVRRRIAEAENSGADALVIQIDSPGGDLGAVLEITSVLKKSRIGRTVAWINPTAFSEGALVALACSEIVVSGGGAFGDVAPVFVRIGPLGNRIRVPLPPIERPKFVSTLLAEIVGSSRRNGYDEMLMQGMTTTGVELWLVEKTQTGERAFINRREYTFLFDEEPPTSNPRLVGPPVNRPTRELRQKTRMEAPPGPTAGPPGGDGTGFIPASPEITRSAVRDASMALTVPSPRPVITKADKGNWKLIEYVADGSSLFTFSDADMIDLKIAAARASTLDELKTYLGAKNVITITPPWYEWVARLLQNLWIRGLLIIVIVLGIFIEFVHPGLILPGSAAALAVFGLLLPEILMGLAGWWEAVMILGGVALIGVELFIMPGVGIAGAIGLLSLLVGLVLAFVPAAAPTFPGMERSSAGLLWGIGFVMIGLTTAATVGYYMSKNMRTLPVLGRLVLRDRPREEDLEGEAAPLPEVEAPLVAVGQEGSALTTLRPSGKADFDGRVVDVISDGPMIGAGTRIRVLVAEQMRVVVEAVA